MTKSSFVVGSVVLGTALVLMLPIMQPVSADQREAVAAAELKGEKEAEQSMGLADVSWNVPLKTAGGTQMWTDHLWRQGYRLQQNSLTGHWRLIDPQGIRRGWGGRERCQSLLDARVPPPSADAAPRHHVILLHGLMRTSYSMKGLEQAINESGDCEVVRLTYASTRGSITHHAAAVREVLEGLPPNATFSFVGHSMGNIVARCVIGDLQRSGDPHAILPRCQAMVMLGPPNQGAAIARRLAMTKVFGWVTGPGAMELGTGWGDFCDRLATPPFPFLIVAGDTRLAGWQNPLVDGQSDFIVSVDEASLEGAERVEIVPVIHAFLMRDQECIRIAIDFLSSHTSLRKLPAD